MATEDKSRLWPCGDVPERLRRHACAGTSPRAPPRASDRVRTSSSRAEQPPGRSPHRQARVACCTVRRPLVQPLRRVDDGPESGSGERRALRTGPRARKWLEENDRLRQPSCHSRENGRLSHETARFRRISALPPPPPRLRLVEILCRDQSAKPFVRGHQPDGAGSLRQFLRSSGSGRESNAICRWSLPGGGDIPETIEHGGSELLNRTSGCARTPNGGARLLHCQLVRPWPRPWPRPCAA